MLGSSGSAHSYIDSLMIHSGSDQPKVDPGHLYCRQQYAVEIIQLIEVPAPSRRFASPAIDSSSVASSSSSSYYSSESESEYLSDDDDEAESVGPSYCSSDTPEQMDSDEEGVSIPDETYDVRVTRVHAWRESFTKDVGLIPSGTFLPPIFCCLLTNRHNLDILPIQHTKRKTVDLDEDDVSSAVLTHGAHTDFSRVARDVIRPNDHSRIITHTVLLH